MGKELGQRPSRVFLRPSSLPLNISGYQPRSQSTVTEKLDSFLTSTIFIRSVTNHFIQSLPVSLDLLSPFLGMSSPFSNHPMSPKLTSETTKYTMIRLNLNVFKERTRISITIELMNGMRHGQSIQSPFLSLFNERGYLLFSYEIALSK